MQERVDIPLKHPLVFGVAMSLMTVPVAPGVSCIQETGVANFMRCNIWHVQGRDCDLVIDTGMRLNPL